MPKPTNIFLVRHGESEGNVDTSIYHTVPDWKVQLTEKGKKQAYAAGIKIGGMSHIWDDTTTQIFTSPYVRAKQTTEQLLRGLSITNYSVKEDPRLREQEYGNLRTPEQFAGVEQARIAYGPFFYRIPYGESGADVYDRCTAFMETLHRDMQSPRWAPGNVIIVTHGFTLRIFLMRWFHWTVDYFHTLKTPENASIYQMKLNNEGRYDLVTEMAVRS